MNGDWAKGVLEWWITNASAACAPGQGYGRKGPPIDALRGRENQTQEVIARLTRSNELHALIRPLGTETVTLEAGIQSARYALGLLETMDETLANLQSPAPTMAADLLHPTVWAVVAGLWEQGHYRVCVQKAVTRLNGDIQDRLNRHDLSDKKLMQQAFSTNPPQPGEPRLRWPGNDTDLSVISMREGILTFSQGVFSAIRNITSHSADEIPKQEAFEMLAAVSLLARWVDECEVIVA